MADVACRGGPNAPRALRVEFFAHYRCNVAPASLSQGNSRIAIYARVSSVRSRLLVAAGFSPTQVAKTRKVCTRNSPFVLGPWERLRFQVFRSRLLHSRNVEFYFDLILYFLVLLRSLSPVRRTPLRPLPLHPAGVRRGAALIKSTYSRSTRTDLAADSAFCW